MPSLKLVHDRLFVIIQSFDATQLLTGSLKKRLTFTTSKSKERWMATSSSCSTPVHPRTEVTLYSSRNFGASLGRWLTPGTSLYRRLGGHQGCSGRVRKISHPPGFDPGTVQPVDSRYTDYAIPAHDPALFYTEQDRRGNIHYKSDLVQLLLSH